MEPWIQMLITVVCSVIASSGFWAYLQKNLEKKMGPMVPQNVL